MIQTTVGKREEIVLHSEKAYDNPFLDVNIDAVFTHEDGEMIAIPGFWNGENEWKVRFAAPKPGKWTYAITCTDGQNASLTQTGTLKAKAIKNPKNALEEHGYPRVMKGKRYFVYADGTPFFYLADTHWMMPDFESLHECNAPGCTCGNQFKHLADDRIKKGFTVYQTYFSSPRYKPSQQGNPGWWEDNTYQKIVPGAFNETMDVMIEYLTENGIVTALGFGTHSSTPTAFSENVEPVLAFARYCVARYACYPVIWLTAQEVTMPRGNTLAFWMRVGEEVGKLDGYHRPNGAHMFIQDATDKTCVALNESAWHEWWGTQGGHGGFSHLPRRDHYRSFYESKPFKPFVESENQYEDIFCNSFCGHDAPRAGAWQAMQCGAAGFSYGAEGIWAMTWNLTDRYAFERYNKENWFAGMMKQGSTEVTVMKKFYEYVGWYKLTPIFDHSCGVFDMRRRVSVASIGKDVFLYYFWGMAKEDGVLKGLKKNVRYQARWFDPVGGKFIDLPDVLTKTGEIAIPPLPSERDWMLVLNDYDLGPYESEPYPVYTPPLRPENAHPGRELAIAKLLVSSEDPEHPAQNLLDREPSTFWRAAAPRNSQVFEADLGRAKKTGYLFLSSLSMPVHRYIELCIYGSRDGKNYDLLCERRGTLLVLGGRFQRYYEPIPGTYRYIRLLINSTRVEDTNPPLELTDFAVYAPEKA